TSVSRRRTRRSRRSWSLALARPPHLAEPEVNPPRDPTPVARRGPPGSLQRNPPDLDYRPPIKSSALTPHHGEPFWASGDKPNWLASARRGADKARYDAGLRRPLRWRSIPHERRISVRRIARA